MYIEDIEFEHFWSNRGGKNVCHIEAIIKATERGEVYIMTSVALGMEDYLCDEEGYIPFHLEGFLKSFEPITDI